MRRKYVKVFRMFIALQAFNFLACATPSAPPPKLPEKTASGTVWEQAKFYAHQAENAPTRPERLASAVKGREVADSCVQLFPSKPDCYFYRAVITGLYYELTVFGYQEGLQLMVSDLEKSVDLDPYFQGAAAYRVLGELFTQVPAGAGAVSRDLDRARAYLEKSLLLSSSNHENHLALCETLIELEDWDNAYRACSYADQLTQAFKDREDYPKWEAKIEKAKKRLAKEGKGFYKAKQPKIKTETDIAPSDKLNKADEPTVENTNPKEEANVTKQSNGNRKFRR